MSDILGNTQEVSPQFEALQRKDAESVKPALEKLKVVEEKPEEQVSTLDFIGSSFREDTLIGDTFDYAGFQGKAFGQDIETYDENFDASKDEELKNMMLGLSPDEITKLGEVSFNKEHWKELHKHMAESKARQQEVALYASQSNWATNLVLGLGISALSPENYIIPYGGVAKGLSKLTRGAINLNRATKGMTAVQALMKRTALTALDTGVEEAAILTLRDKIKMTEIENKGTRVMQAMLFGSVFSTGIGLVKGTLSNRKGVARSLNHYKTLMENVSDDLQLEKLNKIIEEEDLAISTEGQVGTKYRDEVTIYRDQVIDNIETKKVEAERAVAQKAVDKEIRIKELQKEVTIEVNKRKQARAAKKFDDDTQKHRNNLEGFNLGKRLSKTKEINKVYDAHIKQLEIKKAERLQEFAKGGGKKLDELNIKDGRGSTKKYRLARKKLKNKLNKELGAKIENLEKARASKLAEVEAEYQANKVINSTKSLPLDVVKAHKEYLESLNIKPDEVPTKVFTDLKEDIDYVAPRGAGANKRVATDVDGNILRDKKGNPLPFDVHTDRGKYTNFIPEHKEALGIINKYLDGDKGVQLTPDAIKYIARRVGLGGFDPSTRIGRILTNKSARTANELISAFYDIVSPSYGRKTGEFSIVEIKEKLTSTLVTPLKDLEKDMWSKLAKEEGKITKKFTITNEQKYHKMLDELIHAPKRFEARTDITPEVKQILKDSSATLYKITQDFNNKLIDAGVKGSEKLKDMPEEYVHRTWNNQKVRETVRPDAKGSDVIEELVFRSFIDHNNTLKNPLSIDKILIKAEKFFYGLLNVDLEDFNFTRDRAEIYRNLVNKGVTDEIVMKRLENYDQRVLIKEAGLTGKRAPISFETQIRTSDGEVLSMLDFMDTNPLARQENLFNSHTGHLAFAEAGYKDPTVFKELIESGIKMETQRNGAKAGSDLRKSVMRDYDLIMGKPSELDVDDSTTSQMLQFLKAYNFTRVLHYAPVSSLGELANVGAEVGLGTLTKTYLKELNNSMAEHFSLLSKDETHAELQDSLRTVLGVGFEDTTYHPLYSTANTIAKTSKGRAIEQWVIGEAGKMTRSLQGVEKFNRKVAANAMAIGAFNKIKKNKEGAYFIGGITDTNLAEMGLGKFEGKEFIKNEAYNSILRNLDNATTDATGNLQNFNFSQWDDMKAAQTFVNGMNKLLNHSIVNSDITTAKRWHGSMIGNTVMQFKSFDVNATSKVAGRSVVNVKQSLEYGDYRETSKIVAKAVYSMIMGKAALLATASLRYLGDDDYTEKISDIIWDDDVNAFNNVFTSMSRSSNFGIMKPLETFGLVGNVSTFGRSSSLNPFDMLSTSASGQLLGNFKKIGDDVASGKMDRALMRVWDTSNFSKIPLLSVPFNMYKSQIKKKYN